MELEFSAVPDKLYCLLTSAGQQPQQLNRPSITPSGPSVIGQDAGSAGSPIKYDASIITVGGQSVNCWMVYSS